MDSRSAVPAAGRLHLPDVRATRRWLGGWSPPAGLRALRAAIAVPLLLAFSFEVLAAPQVATFATFAGFANLVLASFGGTRRDRLVAHAGLGAASSGLIAVGTLVNGHVVVGAAVTLTVTFVVLMAGSLGPNLAAAGLAVMVSYLLAAASPGTAGMIPSRLGGWWLGTAVAALAVAVTTRDRPDGRLRAALAASASSLAAEVRRIALGDAGAGTRLASLEARQALRAVFEAASYRPTGLADVDLALSNLVELLEWATDLVGDTWADLGEISLSAGDIALLVAAGDVLEGAAALVVGGDRPPDIDRLEALRLESVEELRHLDGTAPGALPAIHASFHARAVAVAARSVAADALVAARLATPETVAVERARWLASTNVPGGGRAALLRVGAVGPAAGTILGRHVSLRSVWTRNSARGAVAVALAVTLADLTDVQHGFWVVLGTLSVLRTTATATTGTAARALLGTALGVLVGAAVVIGVGTDTAVLWAVFPVAVLIAAYAPGVAPFAAGQAAFTAMLVVLYNLLVPVGWTVGVVRVEDIAAGCGISLVIGVLLWPRGAAAVVAADLVQAFSSSADYLVHAVDWALGHDEAPQAEGRAALLASLRLDDAGRALLSEQGPKIVGKDDLWALVGAAQRLRLTAAAVAELPRPTVATASSLLDERARLLRDWYADIGRHIGTGHPSLIAALDPPPGFAVTAEASGYHRACQTYVDQLLRHLQLHHGEIIEPAGRLGDAVHRPWWQPAPPPAAVV